MGLRFIDSAFSQHKEWRFGGIIISTMKMGLSQCATHFPFVVIRAKGLPINEPSSVAAVEEKNAIFLKYFD